MERVITTNPLPKVDFKFNPFQDEAPPVLVTAEGFLMAARAPRWKIWAHRFIPLLALIRTVALYILSTIIILGLGVLLFTSHRRIFYMPSFVDSFSFLTPVCITCALLKLAFRRLLRSDYANHDAYLCQQIEKTLKGSHPINAIQIARQLKSAKLHKEKLLTLKPLWDTYLKAKVDQYKVKNLPLAAQYAFCIANKEDRLKYVKSVKEELLKKLAKPHKMTFTRIRVAAALP